MQTKICKRCGRILFEDEFYKGKNICISCTKRAARLNKRLTEGKAIHTVGELIAELQSFPYDAKVVLLDDIDSFTPITVEYVRHIFKNNKIFDTDKYNNTVLVD